MNLDNVKWLKDGSIDLLVESYSSASLTLQIRGLNDNEMINAVHATSNDRSLASSVVAVSSPPHLLTVRCSSTVVKHGTCFVRISLRVEGVVVALLFADYVTDTSAPAYPNGNIVSSTEGRGLLRSITGTNPAANTEFSETVPTGALWRFISLSAILVTDANVATRSASIAFGDGVANFAFSGASGAHGANLTWRYVFADVGAGSTGSTTANLIVTPAEIMLMAGYTISSVTAFRQVGDDWSAPQLFVEEWINP